MRFLAYLLALAALCYGAYWFVSTQSAARRDAETGQVEVGGNAPPGGRDPGSTLDGAKGAAARIEADGFKRADELDRKTE